MKSKYLSSSFSFALFILVWVELVTATFINGDGNLNEQLVPVEGVPVHQLSHSFPEQDYLSFGYYQQSCSPAESIIHNKVKEWSDKDYTLAPSLIRLHFHDCSIRGCDASILLDNEGGERTAASKTLRGFEPETQRCMPVAHSGKFLTEEKMAFVSIGEEANSVPHGQESITELIEFFQSKGLNVFDLAVLSDPCINPRYLNYLKRKCRWASEYMELDATTPQKLDSVYFTNLEHGMGLLSTEQLLNSDSRTSPLISMLASQTEIFMQQFAASMVKLGTVQVLTGSDEGEVRTSCSCVNSN
ncbi:hem peroxidase [Dillenia turbinata]|uniref:Peroxidase n=1 Tax=Dillenia turbinata TaxID=194707 RepID=A0AAN8VED3_9MAGN